MSNSLEQDQACCSVRPDLEFAKWPLAAQVESKPKLCKRCCQYFEEVSYAVHFILTDFYSLHPSQQYFSHVGTGIYGLNHDYAADKLCCQRMTPTLPAVRLVSGLV